VNFQEDHLHPKHQLPYQKQASFRLFSYPPNYRNQQRHNELLQNILLLLLQKDLLHLKLLSASF
jgi:hypothetical protein